MPRAHRHFLPGYVWHITHRCHQREFLLKFARDRQRWVHWLFEAKSRYGLCVLNYVVTSNHVHLMVQDLGKGEIPRSLQLIAGRTGQEYNQRKGRLGAFWQDRYHATAIETGQHLSRCLVYIDLNMVRAGAVQHPCAWAHGGFLEIQKPRSRYQIIAQEALLRLHGLHDWGSFQEIHRGWVEEALQTEANKRQEAWSSSLAVGSTTFVEEVQAQLGGRARYRNVSDADGMTVLNESGADYVSDYEGEMGALSVILSSL